MQKFNLICILLAIILAGINCSDILKNDSNSPKNSVRSLTAEETLIKESSNQFGLTLFSKMVEADTSKNIFISPLSVSMALGMTYNGAGGSTAEAMQTTLGYEDLNFQQINESYQSLISLLTNIDDKVTFDIANSIWCREDFAVQDSFVYHNETYFDALVENLDFSRNDAADIINAWVSENTNNKIEEIVDSPVDPALVMFLINAIYFNGNWAYEFDPEYTNTASFYEANGTVTNCRMMSHLCDHLYFTTDQFQAVDLPYGDGDFRMMVILPFSSVDLDNFIANLDNDAWNAWLSQFDTTDVSLYLPKFKLKYKNELNDVLCDMGMSVAFNPDEANFSKINPNMALYISKVKHKTFIDVNEEGTEAAAVTSVEMEYTSAGNDIIMRIDRPFIFAIHEVNTGTILFIGKIETLRMNSDYL